MIVKATPHRDLVCGMEVDINESLHRASWRGITLYFCSQQCLERFNATPTLYFSPSRLGNKPQSIKRHRLYFLTVDNQSLRSASASLRRMMGVLFVSPGSNSIEIEYDLFQITLEQIEGNVSGFGLILCSGLHRWRRIFWKFTEENEIDNTIAQAQTNSCNHLPSRLR